MAEVRISSGGIRANVRAGEDLPECCVWKYGPTENEVILCSEGQEADGICIKGYYAEAYDTIPFVTQGDLLNGAGSCYARTTTGVFDDVTYDGVLVVGNEWMSGNGGVITAYVNSSDNRPLGKVLKLNDDETAKISFYSK